MKLLITLFSFLFLTMTLFSQEDFPFDEEDLSFEQVPQIDKNVFNESIWVLDSTYRYEGDGTAWNLDWRAKTSLRNGFADPLIEATHHWSAEMTNWTNTDSSAYTYYPSGEENTFLKWEWNSEMQTWSDTATYSQKDENGDAITFFEKTWDYTNNEFTSGEKINFAHDDNGNQASWEHLSWNTETSTWTNTESYAYQYDENNNLTQSINSLWDVETSTWENFEKRSYEYDINNLRIQFTNAVWDIETAMWVAVYIESYLYDENENRTEVFFQDWNSTTNEWEYSQRYSYTYNENGSGIEFIIELYDENEGWYFYFKETNTYNENELRTYRLRQDWGGEDWINSRQYFRSYDENDNRIEWFRQNWNSENSEWGNYFLYTYVYNTNNRWIEYTRQNWEEGAWKNTRHYLRTYDENENLTQFIRHNWEEDLAAWVNSYRYDYFWSEFKLDVNTDDISAEKITISPNPSTGVINISTAISLDNASASIYSISGKLMKAVTFNGQNTIDISHLPNGIYILNIHTPAGRLVKKIEKI